MSSQAAARVREDDRKLHVMGISEKDMESIRAAFDLIDLDENGMSCKKLECVCGAGDAHRSTTPLRIADLAAHVPLKTTFVCSSVVRKTIASS